MFTYVTSTGQLVVQLDDLRLRKGVNDLRSCLLLQKLVAAAPPSSAAAIAGQKLLVNASYLCATPLLCLQCCHVIFQDQIMAIPVGMAHWDDARTDNMANAVFAAIASLASLGAN